MITIILKYSESAKNSDINLLFLRRIIMSILNLRSNLMGKFKDFGINSLPVIKKSLDQLNMKIKNSNELNGVNMWVGF